jgi:virginiamycin B lyase
VSRSTVLALVAGLVLLLGLPAAAGAVVATEITDPTPNATPSGLAAADAGVTWFTDPGNDRIGRLSAGNAIQGFAAAPAGEAAVTPLRIAVGPDGALWYTAQQGGFGRITSDGVVTRYFSRLALGATGITAGPDGAMWFTQPSQDRIGRITAPTDAEVAAGATRGTVAVYAADAGGAPNDIELGGDGALWFTQPGTGTLGRAVPSATPSQGPTITTVAVPTPGSAPSRLTTGPDGRIWFSAPGSRRIGRIGTNGLVVEMPLPAEVGTPGDVAPAPDGALWFVESGGARDALGRIDDAGQVTRYELPDPQGAPVELVRGSDGDLRYSRAGGRIGRVDTLAPAAQQPLPALQPAPLVPVAGRIVVLQVVSGTIRIRLPGAAGYQPLPTTGGAFPNGTEIDATDGRVRLTAETAPGSGITRTAIFWAGRFVVQQSRIPGAATELRMIGRLSCGSGVPQTTPRPVAQAFAKKRRRPRVGRRLWGDGKGDFRTRGSRATASVRGTRWLVEDRCEATTRVRVFVGVVGVRDRVRGRRVTLTAGQAYVAPGPRRRR